MRPILIMFVALLLVACATPRQLDCAPGADALVEGAGNAAAGGQSGVSKPETGRIYGAPNPTSGYSRGNLNQKSDYNHEARQAGAITNPKTWTADVRLISSAPMSVKYVGALLECLAIDYAMCHDPAEKKEIRADMAALVDKAESHQADWIGAIAALAPSFDRCVLIQIDGSGSSTGEQDAVDPANTAAMSAGIKGTLEGANAIINAEFEETPAAPPIPEASETPPAGGGTSPVEGGGP